MGLIYSTFKAFFFPKLFPSVTIFLLKPLLFHTLRKLSIILHHLIITYDSVCHSLTMNDIPSLPPKKKKLHTMLNIHLTRVQPTLYSRQCTPHSLLFSSNTHAPFTLIQLKFLFTQSRNLFLTFTENRIIYLVYSTTVQSPINSTLILLFIGSTHPTTYLRLINHFI